MEGLLMRKKKGKDVPPAIFEQTTFRVDRAVNKKFRRVCGIEGLKPREVVQKMMETWAEEQLKQLTPKKLQEIVLGQNDQ